MKPDMTWGSYFDKLKQETEQQKAISWQCILENWRNIHTLNFLTIWKMETHIVNQLKGNVKYIHLYPIQIICITKYVAKAILQPAKENNP